MDKKKELFMCVSGPFSNMVLQLPPIAFSKNASKDNDITSGDYGSTFTGEVFDKKEKIPCLFHEEAC